jgi:hypothetical protein
VKNRATLITVFFLGQRILKGTTEVSLYVLIQYPRRTWCLGDRSFSSAL